MKEDFIAYDNLRIAPYCFSYIKDLTIENDINNHAVFKVTGIIDDEFKDDFVHKTNEVTPIEAYYEKGEETFLLFNGVVTNIKIYTIDNVYTISIEAKSLTYGMDIYKVQRSYQNIKMTTHELIDEVMKTYPNSNYIINIPNEPINEFVLQYNETDWQFLKRFISKYNQVIISAIDLEEIHVFFGVPNIKIQPKTEIKNYTISKDVEAYNDFNNNSDIKVKEIDFITYKIKTLEVLNVGEHFEYFGNDFYIKKAIYNVDEGNLENIYDLSLKEGLISKRLCNMNVIGISINGIILEVARDKVKVNLEIENEIDKDQANWFHYASVAASPDGSGWYCMPEIGELIRLYCPTKEEKKAFVINAIGTYSTDEPSEEDRMSNPENKSLKTDSGQEVKFTPEGIKIESNGSNAVIKLNRDGSIYVTGQKNINITCNKQLELRAENNLKIKSKENIDMLCEAGNTFIMSNDKISLKGTRILNNG